MEEYVSYGMNGLYYMLSLYLEVHADSSVQGASRLGRSGGTWVAQTACPSPSAAPPLTSLPLCISLSQMKN